MKRESAILTLILAISLILNASPTKAQIQAEPDLCPNKCDNSTLYTNGIFDSKLKICIYGYQEPCKYGCRINDTTIFPTPSCNMLPPMNTSTSLEKIYDEITNIKGTIPKAYISVHGTEYTIGQVGKVWVQVLDSNMSVINNAVCYVHIYKPDETCLMENTPMNFLEDGVYYYPFLVPNEVGVYPSIVECYYVSTTKLYNATSGVADIGTSTSGNYNSTWIEDGVYWIVNEDLFGGKQRFQIRMNFTNVTQPALQTGLSVIWNGIWTPTPSADIAEIYIMNFTSGNWVLLNNKITNTGGGGLTVANSIATTNATGDGYVENGTVSILINDTNITDAGINNFRSDYISIGINAQFSSQYQHIIGSGEIHVSSPLNLPYTKTTLCGDITEENINTESSCSIFTHTGEFPFPEGEMEDNISITALQTKPDAYWTYKTPMSASCSAIYWIKYYNGTSWVNVDLSEVQFSSLNSNCEIRIPIDLVKGNIYNYMIKMDNYMKYKVMQTKASLDALNFTHPILCDPYALAYNYTYTVPILNNTNISSDIILRTCHFARDVEWWGYNFYNASFYANTSGSYVTFFSELTGYVEEKLHSNLLLLIGYMLQYSMTPKMDNISINTAQISTLLAYINSSVSNITDGIKFIGGTEYSTGESGLTSVQFLKGGSPVNTGLCNITAYYPNGTIFINNQAMTYLSGSNGIYSYTFTVPNSIGIYREDFLCSQAGFQYYASGSFHNSEWSNNITSIYQLLLYMNSTQATQFNSLYSLMLSVNSTINSMNSTMAENFLSINENLTLIYNLVNATNQSIMNKLFLIQDDIASLNQSIINGFLNATNISANITLAQQEVIDTMFALFGNQAKNRNYAYLGIGGGITGLMSGDSGAVYYCKDNMTLAQYSVQNITGSINKTNIFEDLTRCTYGCVQNACVIPAYMIWLYVLLALLAIFFVYLWITRESNGIVSTE